MTGLDTQKPILLAGATSHTGRRLAAQLLEHGARLRCLIHTPRNQVLLPEKPRIEFVYGSLDKETDMRSVLTGVDTVINVAHIRYAPGLINVMARTKREYRFVTTSSTRMFSQFETPVREEVRQAEERVRMAPAWIRWTILRPSMIFGGSDDNNIERLARFLRRGRFFVLFGQGRNLKQPIFVWDLVNAIVNSLDNPRAFCRSYTLAGPEPMDYREMVRKVARALGRPDPVFVCLPLKPSMWLARLLGKVWSRSPVEMIERFGEDQIFVIESARHDLSFNPLPFEEALARKFRGEG